MPARQFKVVLLFHDEELDEEELNKYLAKLDPKTVELIRCKESK